ncbi:MAG: hypothetical protein GXO42_03180 [bacterium]|nr:hypothetical protein [bacterium]
MQYRKGYYLEHRLVQLLRRYGFWCTRLPKSGSAQVPLDVLALRPGIVLGFECKRRKAVLYSKELQPEKLLSWQEATGGKAFLCVYFDEEKKLRFYPADQLKQKEKITAKDTDYLSFQQLLQLLFSDSLL